MSENNDDVLVAPARSGGGDYELTPAGTHIATIYKIIYLGTVPVEWQGQTKMVPKVRIFWELPNETKTFTDKDGNERTVPFAISQKYTLSMGSKSNLRPLVVSMTGAAMTDEEAANFNIYSLLGHSCMLNITHEVSRDGSREYAVVTSAIALPKGTPMPQPVNALEKLNVRTLTQEAIGQLPDYIRKDMEVSEEYHVRFLAPRGDAKPQVPQAVAEKQELQPEDIPFS